METIPDLPELAEEDVHAWVGDASFARGFGYFRDGAIHDARRAGPVLKAQCEGSQVLPYRVQVTLGPTGIVSGDCSCPVGAGGHCKHAAALLLAWLDDPSTFVEVEDMATVLDRRSKADLIALIGKMVDRYPDLEALVELPSPGERPTRPPDPENIRRQVQHAFAASGYEWGAERDISARLSAITDLGDAYAEAGDWQGAAIVYETILRQVLEEYESFHDEGGDLHELANRCVAGLGDCLAATEDRAERMGILRALFDTYAWDVNYGGIDMGYEAHEIIAEQATAEERQQVAAWVREAIPRDDSWLNNYRRQAFGGLLLDLEQGEIDDETWLRICRETGRVLDLVDRLLALGRPDEARAEAAAAGDFDLFRMADIFKAHGRAEQVAGLIRERAQAGGDRRLAEWLRQQALERGDQAEALAWAQHLFWQYPSMDYYEAVKTAAQAAGAWQRLEPEIAARLLEAKQHSLLTEIYLKEGQVDRAIEALGRVKHDWWMGYHPELAVRVAAAAEETRPRDAIRIYADAAQTLIDRRGRENYTLAAGYLRRVRDLYGRLDETPAWQALIGDIRSQNARLRALKEELNAAGL